MRGKNGFRRMISTLQKFPFETQNGEGYWARHPNNYYQSARPGFKALTYSEQKLLPSLPVPSLEKTLEKYIKSIKPYCSDPEQLEHQKALCAEFAQTRGPELQERLVSFSQDKRNWLAHFWDNQAYLEYDDPVVPYVSYFYAHKPLPITHRNIESDFLLKATAIVKVVTDFLESLKNEAIPPENIRGSSFCMNSFQMMFNNSRVPGDTRDSNVFYSIYENNYIVVALRGNFYVLYTHDDNGKPLESAEIWHQFYMITHQLSGSIQEQAFGGVGVLTSLPRSEWYKWYSHMVLNDTSRASLEKVHKSAFVICLDPETKPVSYEEKSRYAWHGDGINRFFDKPLQFFVAGNGSSGFLAEHSKMDGTPTLFLNDYLCKMLTKMNPQQFLAEIEGQQSNATIRPQHLPFVVTPALSEAIADSKVKFHKNVKDHALKVWHYNRYGKSFMKEMGFSPDAFIQQVMQLAVFKYLSRQLPTYEAASTRKFFRGRTETGRAVSVESAEFVHQWQNPVASNEQKITSLRASAKAHAEYLKMAANGLGVDRHFFGLKNMLKSGEPVPQLFRDSLFTYSQTWLISTSQLSSEYFEGYGWSQVNDNGFGLAYMLNKDWMHINIVNKPHLSHLSAEKLHYYLTESADEIASLLILEKGKAKL